MPVNWRVGMFILFSKSVGKITKITDDKIKIRKYSKGKTKNGYDWQQYVSRTRLNKLIKDKKVKVIDSTEVLQCVFYNYEGCMPIEDMEGV